MVIVLLEVHLSLPGVCSLKEKRRRIKSLITRLRNNFNISVAEVADNDVHRSATLGVAVVTNDSKFGDQVIAQVVNKIEAEPEIIMGEYRTEIV